MKYEVRIPEVHYSYRFVEADSPEAAKHLALYGRSGAHRDSVPAIRACGEYKEYMEYSCILEEGVEVIELKGDN